MERGPADDIVARFNDWLIRDYGIDTESSRAMYRIVWSNNEFEKRLTKYTDTGIELIHPEIREVPKYRQWAKDRYILEYLCHIEVQTKETMEMTVNRITYEPLWSFIDNQMNYLPPNYDVCKIIIDTVLAARNRDGSLTTKYRDPALDPEETQKRIVQLQAELFGNETATGDALAYKEGVGYTGPSKITQKVHNE